MALPDSDKVILSSYIVFLAFLLNCSGACGHTRFWPPSTFLPLVSAPPEMFVCADTWSRHLQVPKTRHGRSKRRVCAQGAMVLVRCFRSASDIQERGKNVLECRFCIWRSAGAFSYIRKIRISARDIRDSRISEKSAERLVIYKNFVYDKSRGSNGIAKHVYAFIYQKKLWSQRQTSKEAA